MLFGMEFPLPARALRFEDAAAVTELIAVCEQADTGEVAIELEDIIGDWKRPSFDLAADSLGLFEGEDLVAYADVYKARRATVYVDPANRGRGLGALLMRWTWERTRAAGGVLVGQTVPDSNTGAVALFLANGYAPMWTSWVLRLPPGAALADLSGADGITIRAYVPGREEHAAYEVVENAFNEWPDRDPSTYDDWAAGVLGRPGFEPWNLQVAVDAGGEGEGEVVGVCHVFTSGETGWVNQIAVRKDQRGRGLGQALLRSAFAAARERGAPVGELSTDSRTGALGLYEHLGMRVTSSYTHYALPLTP
jgi:mycothiol synthase